MHRIILRGGPAHGQQHLIDSPTWDRGALLITGEAPAPWRVTEGFTAERIRPPVYVYRRVSKTTYNPATRSTVHWCEWRFEREN